MDFNNERYKNFKKCYWLLSDYFKWLKYVTEMYKTFLLIFIFSSSYLLSRRILILFLLFHLFALSLSLSPPRCNQWQLERKLFPFSIFLLFLPSSPTHIYLDYSHIKTHEHKFCAIYEAFPIHISHHPLLSLFSSSFLSLAVEMEMKKQQN